MPDPPYNGKPITPTQVAKLLKPYKVRPSVKRFGEETSQGYLADQFEKAWPIHPAAEPDGDGDADT